MMSIRRLKPIKRNAINGISLVEVMVASTLSFGLLAGILQIYLSEMIAAQFTTGLETIQDNARFLFKTFDQQIHMSGYRSNQTISNEIALSSMNVIFAEEHPFISGTTSTQINGSDTLTIHFQGSGDGAGNADGSLFDCNHTLIDANQMGTSTFAINNDLQFTCNDVAMVDNVEQFKVLFGEDTTNDNNVNRYVPANYPGLDLHRILSVQISFLLRSEDGINEMLDTNTYHLLNDEFDPTDDYRIRKVFTKTLFLRNFNS